jgi:hypothetical protein
MKVVQTFIDFALQKKSLHPEQAASAAVSKDA